MQFYNATTKDALCQEVDRLCDTSDSNYTRLDKTARINAALQTVVSWIITADGTFEFDDANQTDLPRATFTLQEGVANYNFSTEFLRILEIEVKDANGVFHRIKPLDPDQLGDMSWDEYFGVVNGTAKTGMPQYYDPSADGIVFDVAPTASAVTLSAGGRITFQRKAVAFTAVATTATDSTQPGFASPFHVILAYMAAIPYCMAYKKDRVDQYKREVGSVDPRSPYYGGMALAIVRFYSRRNRDQRNIITTKPVPRL